MKDLQPMINIHTNQAESITMASIIWFLRENLATLIRLIWYALSSSHNDCVVFIKNRYYFCKQETALEIQHGLLNSLDFSFCFSCVSYIDSINMSSYDKIKLIERKKIYNRWREQQIANNFTAKQRKNYIAECKSGHQIS